MSQRGRFSGHDELHKRSQGIAPSIACGLGTPARLILHAQHVRQDNLPDGGAATIGLEGPYNAAFCEGGTAEGTTLARVAHPRAGRVA